MKKNPYTYKNITRLGSLIFLGFALVLQLLVFLTGQGPIESLDTFVNTFGFLAYILLPIAFIASILVIVSNLVLVKNEGLNWRNFLGLILGGAVCLATILPELLDDIFHVSDDSALYNDLNFYFYFVNFVDTLFYSSVAYLECILIATIVLSVKAAKSVPAFDKNYILILGCLVRKDGSLSNILRARVDRALEFRELQKSATGKDLIFVPSGGKGTDETLPEAVAIKNYLLKKGISPKNILVEDKSTTTLENLKFSRELIKNQKPRAKVAFSTTNYHVFRACALGASLGWNLEGIGAKTKTYFWLNAFIREFVANLVTERKKHLLLLLVLWLLSAAGTLALYLSRTLLV